MARKYVLYGQCNPRHYYGHDDSDGSTKPVKNVASHGLYQRHGVYATPQLAQWWAINAHGVWWGGDTGPHSEFWPRANLRTWYIVELEDN